MLTVKERRAPGRFGGSPETLDQDQERALKRRILLENDLGAEDAAELAELVRTRRFGLDGLADWLGQRRSVQQAAREAGQPCKFTRVELEIALAERQLAAVMSPRSALAYASWMVAAERGWNPANLETSGVSNDAALASPTMKGALAPTFQYLQPRGEPAPIAAKAETSAEPAARPARLAEGSGLHALPVLFINPLRRLGSESEATQPARGAAPVTTAAPAPAARLAAKRKNDHAAAIDRDELLEAVMTLVRQDGGGEPLPADALSAARAQLGTSAAQVRVHTSERAGEAATLLGAAAFTIGRHIYFAPGEFAPGTEAGDRLLRHELTHVQQYERGELAAQGKAELTSETSAAEAEAHAAEAHDWAGMKRGPQTPQPSGHGASLSDEQVARLAPHLGDDGARAAAAARLHTDATAADFAAEHQAHAVTVGSDIYFGRGAFTPGTEAGDELLVHELTHVAQGQRGELTHAAAKGLTSGTNLDPAEAEAELRGKLAAIELHAPAAKPVAVAPPAGGQPTTDGERAARLAEQKKRLADAEADSIPDEEVKPPESVAPQGAVAHPGPEMTAPKTSGDKKNAYVDALDAPPSKQAMTLWAQTAGKATTEANADQAAFDAALPPMPIELTGDEAKPTKGGAQAHQPKGKEQAPGSLPPSAQPTPTPAPPPVTAASASVENIVANPDKAAMEAEGKKAIAALPTTSPDVKTDPGTPPVTDLAGQGDPIRVTADQEQAYADGAKGLEAEKKKILAGPGAAQVQPKLLNEKLEVPKAAPPGQMPELPKVEGMDKFKKWNLPGGVQSSFDDVAKPKMEANLAQAKAKMSEAEVKRDQDRDKAVADAQTKVKAAHADADAKQQAKVAESRTKITNKQAETLGKQEAEVKKLDKQSGEKKKATLSKVNDRIAKDQAKVETDYTDAQKKADAEKQKGEAEAKKKKEEAEKKANEEKSWWDKVADAVCDAIQAIADEIDKALEAVGKLIGDILDAVKNAACQLIDAARDFVCAALSEFGDWLKSAVTALIGSVFPELAAALNKFIDDAVNAAKDAVNAIADGLKSAVTALCDGLKAAVNAAIAAYRAAVQAAATLAKALVTGDWAMVAKMVLEGILKLLGIDPEAFYALVGKAEDSIAKIIDDPGAFVGHLVDAVKLGFKQFGANFLTHLKDGVVQWLFGTFAEAGINIPAKFDVAGVFDLTCQVLGLTWPRLRVKVVKVIGEKNTERLEFVAGYIEALVTGGFAGLWEKVQQDMAGLWETVIGGAKQWLMEKLVEQAIIKIATMWNPAGAIIQLIQTAWNVYCWVKENAQRIFGLVQAVVDSISNIANGNIAGAANYIESSLAKLVPIAISLFANLLGLGGIADKIKSIIEKIQTKVDQAIDKLIDRVAKLFKGKDKGKGDDKDGDGKADDDKDKADENKPVGARITFTAHGETHTQYIDKGVPMVASTPTGVKAKIEEWRPRLRELTDEQQKRAGKLIGKAIGIEKKVAELAGQAKSDKTKEASLEAKQRELADTLAQLWEIMAPDMDPNKPFAEQDPMATLKTDQYRQFKSRFTKLAADLDMPGGDAKAQELWLQVVTTLQKTDAAYKAAPTAGTSGRKDLAADGFKKIMAEFEPITAAIKPYMDKYAKGKKSWAFWSGKPSVELAKKHGEVCLEKSALGGLFDNINISGGWDIQMWASLSKAYATHAASHVGDAKYSGFVGLGSSADQSIFNKIEQPQFVGMLSEKQKVDLKIDWYAGACNPENINQPDYRFKAGSIDGVYAKGDRAAMVDKAETENKRRIDLFKEKGINEGPEGGTNDGDDKPPVPVVATGAMKGEGHTLTADPAKGEIRLASVESDARGKVFRAIDKIKAMQGPANAKSDAMAALQAIETKLVALQDMMGTRKATQRTKITPAQVEALKKKTEEIMADLKVYGETFGTHDVDDLPTFDKFFASRFTIGAPNNNKTQRAGAPKTYLTPPPKPPMMSPSEKLPGYVVNMTSTPGEAQSNMAARYFGDAWKDSAHPTLVKLRTAVIIGINSFRSIDPDHEKGTLAKIAAAVSGVEHTPESMMAVFGFFWEPTWNEDGKQVTVDHVREEWKKLPSSERATARTETESKIKEQLPYGVFRNEVIESQQSQSAVAKVGQVADPVHILTQDADGGVIAASGKGLFTEYDKVLSEIARHPLMTIGGYRFSGFDWADKASPRTQQLTLLANEIDRAVRAAIAKILPDMLYPTEPNMLIKAQDKTHHDGIMDKGTQKGLFGDKTAEGRAAKNNIVASNTGTDAHPNPVAYAPSTSTTTSPVPERLDRGLTVDEDQSLPENRENAFDGIRNQAQNPIHPDRMAHELGKTTGAETHRATRKNILGRPVEIGQQLSNNPDAQIDLAEEQSKIDAEASRLKTNASIKKSEDAKKAVDKAAAIAKSIISALTSAEMRPLWIQLKALLDEIYEAREDKK